MKGTPAPFFADVAGGPDGGCAYWVTTQDDVRIRVGVWTHEKAAKGTILMFPGRTEYIEKYGDFAREMQDRGYSTLAIDWRGQGLADRLLPNRSLGHVGEFTDYQWDVAAALRLAQHLELPEPWHLVGHSMGGAIGLRAVMDGTPAVSCCFTGPMWGIYMSPAMRPASFFMTTFGPFLGLGTTKVPTTPDSGYVLESAFEDNTLTTDPQMFKMMQEQLQAHPDLTLGGPTIRWLSQGVAECNRLSRRPSPDLPCITFLGTNERIVDVPAIHKRMEIWPRGVLELIEGGEHEVIMEAPAIRIGVFDRMAVFFDKHGHTATAGAAL
ncbi:MAG: alpha/beta fold hydrolase [Rhodobacteraceae bacterium]|nr:alpha/beta fold hydrolase [Paracoccaceae bacterium]